MKFIQFVFSFLFVRNWYTGHMELSLPRLILFATMLFLLLLGILIASFLQTPVTYTAA